MAELAASATVASSVAGRNTPKLLDYLVQNHKLRVELEHDINYLRSESPMISAAIQEDGDRPPWNIEDCIDRFTHRVTLKPGVSWIGKKLHRVKTRNARNKFAAAIRRLTKKSEDASKLRTSYITGEYAGGSSTLESGEPSDERDSSVAAVGMDVPRDELIELIREAQQGQPKELEVISDLHRRIRCPAVVGEYEARAWVRAAQKGAGDVLKEILQQLGMQSTITSSGGSAGKSCHPRNSKLCASLRECLGTKRFFIVIDDMQAVFWHDIKDAFPVIPGVSSRVMVTTAIHSVANACSSAHGHVYMMATLAEDHSRQLFFKEACLKDPPPPGDTQLGSEALKKCDGLPLALVTTARFLQSGGDPTRVKWANLCENLGGHLETNETLASMKRVLVHSYTSLGKQDVKTFTNMESYIRGVTIYPSGHPIRRGRLTRKWLAEGFVKQDHRRNAHRVTIDNFDELVDRSIIQPIDASSSNSVEVKRYQIPGMMLGFILHKSMCENFVTLLYDQDPLPGSNIRWLSLHHKRAVRSKMNPKDLLLVRSLTVFGKAHTSVLDFPKYELMRVLDLEECDEHLKVKHLKKICSNLLLLRYLSLGSSLKVLVLPKEIKKLQFLETLDLRRSNIEILPTQVIELPCLLQAWLSENSKLKTIAGFLLDKNQELPQLMDHMEHLTKVKIWCESTCADDIASNNLSHLSRAIKAFIERGTQLNEARSLSLNIDDAWSNLLNFSLEHDYSYYLSLLKLQGNNICSQLPLFVTMQLGGLTKLCLSFTSDLNLSGDALDDLGRVRGLEYLKLIATQMDKLVIGQGALISMRHLCIVVEVMTELEIQKGALPRFESLKLLCKDLNGFSGMTVQSLPRLKEVGLHDGVSDETKYEWKEAAKNHPRRPKLLFVDINRWGVAVESEPAAEINPAAATNMTTDEVDVETGPAAKISPVAPPTTAMLSVTTLPDAAEESVHVVGDGQHDDDDEKEDGNIDDPKDFAKKNGPSTQMIDQTNKESSKQKIEGVAGLEDQQMEDGTKCLRARLSSLVEIGVFR
ncbi:hypothetical protein VPH35_095465 [Triticum aestivum]